MQIGKSKPGASQAADRLLEYERVVDGLEEMIVVVDRQYRYVIANRAFLQYRGMDQEQLIGRRVADILNPGVFERDIKPRLDECLSGNVVKFELRYTYPALGNRDLFISYFPVSGPEGIDRAACVLRDVSELKQSEEARLALEQRLRQAQSLGSIGRLAGGIAHDFNNLLTVINGYSDLVLSHLHQGEPLRSHLEEIRKAGERAAGLTRQMLIFSRNQIIEQKPLNLSTMVAESEDMLRRLLGEDIQLVTELDPSLGPVMADPGQMHRVLLNLAVNARDAMPRGGRLTIETANIELDQKFAAGHPGTKPGPFVMWAFGDTGAGIKKEIQGRIFDPFFTTKAAGEGTGLGLSTVYGIVSQCGGCISVSSEPGHGATFKMYLPRAEADIASEECAVPMADAPWGSETVLVVEDQEAVRKLAVEVLKKYGYRTLEAAQGDEALLLAERYSGPIDLMLTDVIMPIMTGKELADRLSMQRPHLRVLYMSGYSADLISRRGQLDPGVLYIAKPFTPDTLAVKVREALGTAPPVASVLVVDDEESIRNLFRLTLAGAGYRVVAVEDGRQAMAKMHEQRFDLLITDLVMPEQEGIELIRTLHKEKPDVKIVAISGAFQGRFLKVAKALGANATLAKPVSTDALLATVRSLLGQ